MSTPEPIDPRIGQACDVRCGRTESLRAATSILLSAGCPDEFAASCARNLHEMGITFTSRRLAEAMAEITNHHGR